MLFSFFECLGHARSVKLCHVSMGDLQDKGILTSKIWRMTTLCFLPCIWKEHNHRTFEELESLDQSLKDSFLKALFISLKIVWGLVTLSFLILLIVRVRLGCVGSLFASHFFFFLLVALFEYLQRTRDNDPYFTSCHLYVIPIPIK